MKKGVVIWIMGKAVLLAVTCGLAFALSTSPSIALETKFTSNLYVYWLPFVAIIVFFVFFGIIWVILSREATEETGDGHSAGTPMSPSVAKKE